MTDVFNQSIDKSNVQNILMYTNNLVMILVSVFQFKHHIDTWLVRDNTCGFLNMVCGRIHECVLL